MKTTLLITGAILLLAYSQHNVTQNNITKARLIKANETINMIGKTKVAIKNYIYKYRSPIALQDIKKNTSPFGYRELRNPFTGGTRTSNHKGLDIVGTWHCRIRPIGMNGEVVEKWYPPSSWASGHDTHGGYVRIKHTDGWIEGHSHLSEIYVKEGDLLIDGLFYRDGKLLSSMGILGRQGNTGLSEGEHLHLSIQTPDGTFVDPLHYIDL